MNDSLLNLHYEYSAVSCDEGETFYRACGLMRAAVAYIDAVDWRYASEEQAARVALAARLDALSAFNLLGNVLDGYRDIDPHQQINLVFPNGNSDKTSGIRSELTLQDFDVSVLAQSETLGSVTQDGLGAHNISSSPVDNNIEQSDSIGEDSSKSVEPNEATHEPDRAQAALTAAQPAPHNPQPTTDRSVL